ncbi:CDP-diacylglycerol--glycerol-3-phosphate 3-phosphatidyltransferase 1, chloroplastic-like [Diospyros lotus]|uniref:CDP-diacylglycerol--glycerol-3-phosphate 3-phosphatidyltransferase 1, chloroplastic-like n=1 Tax=Diospyros lotus TaxID=55363 RepID=UPI00224FBBC2|nr:CDP-diacylglycerol--glycerol-3-phosphate 3-phosphatidyltransferase 1, chloroplastic-like [Diospyros lotus]
MGFENRTSHWPPPQDNASPQDLRQPPRSPEHKLLTLPTILTISRVAAIPLLVSTFYMDNCWGTTATASIFIAAAITDWLDGYLARRMRLGTAFGAFLDPVADKLMVAATLILLCSRPLEVPMFAQMQWLLTVPAIMIIGREITMSAVREWAASQNSKFSEAVAVNNLGKWKTATQMTALMILLSTRGSSLSGSGTLVASGVVLLYISAWLSLWSLVVYMRKIWKVLLK